MDDPKQVILDFLKKHSGKKFSMRQVYREINKDVSVNISYPSVMKWIEVLFALKKIKMEDYNVVKLVYYEN